MQTNLALLEISISSSLLEHKVLKLTSRKFEETINVIHTDVIKLPTTTQRLYKIDHISKNTPNWMIHMVFQIFKLQTILKIQRKES